MPLHAIDDISDAIDATKSLFTPVDVRQWFKLAVVVFFIGGGGGGLSNVQSLSNINQNGQNGSGGGSGGFGLTALLDGGGLDGLFLQTGEPPIPPEAADQLAQFSGLIIGAFVLVGLLVLAYGLLSNFMEFVFVQSLIDREVHVRQYCGEHLGNGLRLLVFRLAVNLLTLLAVAAFGALVFFLVFDGSAANVDRGALFTVFPLAIVFVVGLSIVLGIVSGFTNVFVIPLMTRDDSGVIGGWRRLLASIRGQPKQYLAYLVVSVVLAIGVGIVGSIVGFIALLVIGIPFGLVGFGIFTALHGTVGLVLLGIVGLLFVLMLALVSSFVNAPLEAFLRYYAMLVMGDIDESLDPIPEVRGDIRA